MNSKKELSLSKTLLYNTQLPILRADHKEDINFKITKFIRELEKNVSGAQSEAASSELVLYDLQMEKAVLLLRECRHYLQK